MDTLIKTHYDAVCERYGEDNVFFVFLYEDIFILSYCKEFNNMIKFKQKGENYVRD